jgi:hypothetical protein
VTVEQWQEQKNLSNLIQTRQRSRRNHLVISGHFLQARRARDC